MKNNGGDDWDDAPYESNADEPYDHWNELIEDNENVWERKYKIHLIELKTLYFETNDWSQVLPCDNYLNSEYSVEAINKKAIAWLHTDKYNILAGTSYEDFISIIEQNGGKVYEERKR